MRCLGILFLIACVIPACSKKGDTSSSFDSPTNYFSTMTSLTIEIAYEPGAEPFIGSFTAAAPSPFTSRNYWDITEENLKALFQGRTKAVTVTVPKTIETMTAIPAQNQTGWTSTMITNLAAQYRQHPSTATEGYLFLIFLKGYYESDGAQQPEVIGVNISGTPYTAVFKDVVSSTGLSPTGRVPKYVEQSTVVHELGHALGLVNNGVPPSTSHQDTAHGAHCTNSDCVMYYLNEGKTDLVAFVQAAETSGSLVIFKDECLNDTKQYSP